MDELVDETEDEMNPAPFGGEVEATSAAEQTKGCKAGPHKRINVSKLDMERRNERTSVFDIRWDKEILHRAIGISYSNPTTGMTYIYIPGSTRNLGSSGWSGSVAE